MEIQHEKYNGLIEMLGSIEGVLSLPVNHEDGNQVSDMISQLSSLLSTSANAVAVSEQIYNEKLGKVLLRLPEKMSATDKKLILTGELSNEKFLVTTAERQNAALVHAIDSMRSILSYIKEEARMNSQYNPNPR